MKIVCISDTHRMFANLKIPEAEVLIHAGDIDSYEFNSELKDFNKWLGTIPCKHKIVIAGNHDGFIDKNPKQKTIDILTNATYLESSGIEINGVKFWGAPFTPIFNNWFFMLPTDMLKEEWEKIPLDTDILITHGPPMGILDHVWIGNRHVGCPFLAQRIKEVKPKLHVFGHIHEQYGIIRESFRVSPTEVHNITYINCSVMDEQYDMINSPISLYYYKETGDVVT